MGVPSPAHVQGVGHAQYEVMFPETENKECHRRQATPDNQQASVSSPSPEVNHYELNAIPSSVAVISDTTELDHSLRKETWRARQTCLRSPLIRLTWPAESADLAAQPKRARRKQVSIQLLPSLFHADHTDVT